MAQVREIIETDIARIDADNTLASAMGALTQEGSVLVFDKESFIGSLTTRKIVRTRLNPSETKVRGLITKPPRVDPDTELLEAARLMVESDLLMLPVEENEKVIGVVRAADVLVSFAQSHDLDLVAKDIMSQPVITIEHDALLSTAANMIYRKDISRLPVTDGEDMVGLVTMSNIIGNMLNHNKADIFMLEEQQVLQNTQVRNAMDRSFATEHPDSPVTALAERMSEDIRTIIITETGEPLGIITQRDLLEAFLASQSEQETLSITVALKDDSISADRVREELLGFSEKFSEQLGIGTMNATVEKHKETHKGLPRMTAKLRILTDRVGVSAIGEGWGEAHAIRDALKKAETQMMR